MEVPLTTQPVEDVEFDQICSEVDEFELLPSVAASDLTPPEREREEETSLDGQILAGLVSP